MKKTITTLILIISCFLTFAQAPQGFEYQAVVRSSNGNILVNQSVGIQITIKQGSASGTNVYQETFNITTNQYGLVNLQIGSGITVDDFTLIDWANGPYFIEVAIDVTGGASYSVMGTSQLLSVPYALHAKTVEINDACNLFNYFYADRDTDGFGDPFNLVFSCSQPFGFVTNNLDCDDNNSAISPSATEICDAIDNNCNGQIDEGITLIQQYTDNDGDGFGDFNSSPSFFCSLESGYAPNNSDCDDNSNAIYPGATEICGNNIDEDCDGVLDNGFCLYTYFKDQDNDGWGGSIFITSCSSTPPSSYVNRTNDCNDNNPNVYPMQTEINGDGIDNDCYGGDNTAASIVDNDGDGITFNYDCNDNDPTVYPGAPEPCGGNVDLNCDGFIN